MAQGVLPFKYEEEKSSSGMTALAGLPALLDLAKVLRLAESVATHVGTRGNQGWTDAQLVTALVLLQLAGGDCVDDLRVLEGDDGFSRVLRHVEAELMGLPRSERRRMESRWRKEKQRSVPSPSAARRFLNAFSVDESGRGYGKAWIPEVQASLRGLRLVNRDLIARINAIRPQTEATLDEDATCIEVWKQDALRCYKGFKAFQPLNVYWAEHDVMLHSEFRDGNVPAQTDNLRVLLEALDYLPESVQTVRFRSDSAAYQWDLMLYLAKGLHPRFGVIEFTVSVDVSTEFHEAVTAADVEWTRLYRSITDSKTGRISRVASKHEYAEICFEPRDLSRCQNNPTVRFLAVRERLAQQPLPEMTAEQLKFPFPVMKTQGGWYKLHGIVSNRLHMPPDQLILWHWARCGKSEEAHDILKGDLAGGRLPSGDFGSNAAWWAITILAYNLQSAMKHAVLGGSWAHKRLKAFRFHFICLPGRVIEHARQLIIRLSAGHPSLEWLLRARERLLMSATAT